MSSGDLSDLLIFLKSVKYFRKKIPSQMFDWVLDTLLQLCHRICYCWVIFSLIQKVSALCEKRVTYGSLHKICLIKHGNKLKEQPRTMSVSRLGPGFKIIFPIQTSSPFSPIQFHLQIFIMNLSAAMQDKKNCHNNRL